MTWRCPLCSHMNQAEVCINSLCVGVRPVSRGLYLSIDIERASPDFSSPILAIGVCFGRDDGTILEQRAFCHSVPPRDEFEPSCSAFWAQHEAVLARIDAEAVPTPIRDFHAWLVQCEKKYGPFGRKHQDKTKLVIVTDCAYDLAHIAVAFDRLSLRRGVQEMFDDYVSHADPTERIRGLPAKTRAEIEAQLRTPHDHWPVNDATRTYELMVEVAKHLN